MAWYGTSKTVSIPYLPRALRLILADNAPRGWHANTTWEDALKSLIWSCDDDQPRFRHEEWHKIFQQPCNRFFESPIETDTERWAVWLKPDEVWDRFSTLSQISVMEADDKEVRMIFPVNSDPRLC